MKSLLFLLLTSSIIAFSHGIGEIVKDDFYRLPKYELSYRKTAFPKVIELKFVG